MRSRALYTAAILYVISAYAFPFIFFAIQKSEEGTDKYSPAVMIPLLMPLIFGMVNLITVILHRDLDAEVFFTCAVLIKYALIPFYIFGGLCIALAILFMFTPVVIMVFVGPVIATTLSVMGWIVLICGAPFPIAYLVKAAKQGLHPVPICIASGIAQFFFTFDVLSVMLLAVTSGKWRKLSIGLCAVFLVALFAIGVFILAIFLEALL